MEKRRKREAITKLLAFQANAINAPMVASDLLT